VLAEAEGRRVAEAEVRVVEAEVAKKSVSLIALYIVGGRTDSANEELKSLGGGSLRAGLRKAKKIAKEDGLPSEDRDAINGYSVGVGR